MWPLSAIVGACFIRSLTQMPQPAPLKNAWLQNMIESLVVSFKNAETRQWLQVFIVDPIVAYLMERCMPYIIICCIIIVALLCLVIGTFLMVFKAYASRGAMCPHCATT